MANIKDDIEFLQELRSNVDQYLFLGHAPSIGSPGTDPDAAKMEAALREPKFQELRKKIVEAKTRAKKTISRFNTDCVYVQYPPRAIGGPVIKQHFLDIVTENMTWKQIKKATILDMLDQTIGALRDSENTVKTDAIQNKIHKNQKEKSVSEKLSYPDKITLAWLFCHAPIKMWCILGSIMIAAFLFGIRVGQTSFIKELFGK